MRGAKNRSMPVIAGLHYFVHGDEDPKRPPLILVHGAGGFHLSWPPQVRRLADRRVYAIDLPGHGGSPGSGRSTVKDYADDMAAFMSALDLKYAVIAGHSMGSGIALTLALKHPEKVQGLVLIGAGARLRVAPAILAGLKDAKSFHATVQMINDYSFTLEGPPRLKELSTQRMAETSPSVLYNDFKACDAFDLTDQLEKINIPTLIICGAQDRMTAPRFSEYLHDAISNSRLEIVEKAGHMMMLEQPQLLVELISRFLDDLPPLAER
jgi:pimeloyl-ACP methyl ester carboxylesterase